MVGGHVGGLNEQYNFKEIQSIVDNFGEQEEPDSIIDNSKLIDSICQKFSSMLDSKIHGQLIRELSSQFSLSLLINK
ncbi:hypothetical protein MXB_5111 [Myxobolus squamalis]|nr:hypothetical protein MXB_5111 [Myxobolus squamalis]